MAAIVLGTSIFSVVLMISLVGLGHFETLAQGTNATTSSTNATNGSMLLVQVGLEQARLL